MLSSRLHFQVYLLTCIVYDVRVHPDHQRRAHGRAAATSRSISASRVGNYATADPRSRSMGSKSVNSYGTYHFFFAGRRLGTPFNYQFSVYTASVLLCLSFSNPALPSCTQCPFQLAPLISLIPSTKLSQHPPHSMLIPVLTPTTQVHYLQASSKPEPCWTLLGSASRMAVALGFHQKTRKVDSYSAIELEEGKRAWWLCLIMEKSVHLASSPWPS